MVHAADMFWRDHLADPILVAEELHALEPTDCSAELLFRLMSAQYAFNRAMGRNMAGIDAAASGGIVEFDLVQFYTEACFTQLFRIIEQCDGSSAPWPQTILELQGFKPLGVTIARNKRFEHMESHEDPSIRLELGGPVLQPHVEVKRHGDSSLSDDVDTFSADLHCRLAAAVERLGDPI